MIRLAKEADLPHIFPLRDQVHALHVNGRPDTFKMPEDPSEFYQQLAECLPKENFLLFVLEEKDTIIGYALVQIGHPKNIIATERIFYYIEEFAIDSAYRRQGFGKQLMDYIIYYANDHHADSVELEVWDFNRDAIAFYESLGATTKRTRLEIKLS